jgi:transcriptional regulator with XRE-family HTH domain
MTGEQLKLLRKMNGITQAQLASRVQNRCDRNSVYRAELQPFVPIPFIKALSDILGVNLSSPQVFERVCKEVGISLILPETPTLDWRKVFYNYIHCTLPISDLFLRYCSIFSPVSHAHFQTIVVNAVTRGEIRPVGEGVGVIYGCRQFDFPETLPDNMPETADNDTK